jgi:hypothetical protein
MGLKDFLRKDKGTEFPMDAPPPYEPSRKSNEDLETYGHSTHVQTLGRWRACVILITIEVGIGILSLYGL